MEILVRNISIPWCICQFVEITIVAGQCQLQKSNLIECSQVSTKDTLKCLQIYDLLIHGLLGGKSREFAINKALCPMQCPMVCTVTSDHSVRPNTATFVRFRVAGGMKICSCSHSSSLYVTDQLFVRVKSLCTLLAFPPTLHWCVSCFKTCFYFVC